MNDVDTFAAWSKEYPPQYRKVAAQLRSLAKSVAPKLTEQCKWTNWVWCQKELPLLFIHVKANGIQFGFFAGERF